MAQNALGLRVLTNMSSQLKTVDRRFASSVRKNLRSVIQKRGADVLGGVRAAASWSSRIPAATNLSIRYNVKGASVRIQVNHNQAPHARPYELGNKNQYDDRLGSLKTVSFVDKKTGQRVFRTILANASTRKLVKETGTGVSRTLRHPVFHKSGEPGGWAVQPTRPFFFPTIAARKGNIDQDFERLVVQVANDAGFH